MDTSINGTLFAEAGAWGVFLRYFLFPLIRLKRKATPDETLLEATGKPFIPRVLRMNVVILSTGVVFYAIAFFQGVPLQEALTTGGTAVGLAIAAYQTEQGVRNGEAHK